MKCAFAWKWPLFFSSLSFDFSKPWESGLEHRINIEIIVIISVERKEGEWHVHSFFLLQDGQYVFIAGPRLLSPFWSVLFYFSMVMFSLAQQMAIVHTLVSSLIAIRPGEFCLSLIHVMSLSIFFQTTFLSSNLPWLSFRACWVWCSASPWPPSSASSWSTSWTTSWAARGGSCSFIFYKWERLNDPL